jgi:hypothetical protein
MIVVAGALVIPGKALAQITVQQISVQHGLAVSNTPARNIVVKPVSPITYFRELLAMKPAERARALGDKSAAQKENLLTKIKEYEAMSPEERELRLKMTEVRWYLVPLMKLAPIERIKTLAALPSADRELIERRLKTWDTVPLDLQKLFLKNENVIGYLLRYETMTPDQRNNLLQQFSPDQRQKWDQQLTEWRNLPSDQRHQMCESFNQFFELNDKEREKTLSTLSDVERQQMEKALDNFNDLPAPVRRKCIDSFRTLANMTPEQRDQFLKNAERWQSMTPGERQAWREIVQKTPQQPPMPPMLPPAPPPLPFRLIAATNSVK